MKKKNLIHGLEVEHDDTIIITSNKNIMGKGGKGFTQFLQYENPKDPNPRVSSLNLNPLCSLSFLYVQGMWIYSHSHCAYAYAYAYHASSSSSSLLKKITHGIALV